MPAFTLDHIVIQTLDREAFVAEIAARARLPVLQGYSPSGVVQSSGVRFANGPFLDVFATPEPGTAMILRGEVDAAEALARERDWAGRYLRPGDGPAGELDFPWSMALFRKGQGLLTHIGVIEYDDQSVAWSEPDFSGLLYRPELAGEASARLARVWLSTQDLARAEDDLAALGYVRAGDWTSIFAPHAGVRFTGPAADLVLCEGPEAVARLDIAAGAGPALELAPPGAPRLVLDEAV